MGNLSQILNDFSRFSYLLKRHAMAPLYWRFLIKGHWHGPATIRKSLHPVETLKAFRAKK
jgi:hypothetical protein